MIDFQVAFDKLAQFETADELAEFFRYEGIKAIPWDSNNCAVSAWMKRTIGKESVYSSTYAVSEYDDNSKECIVNRARTTLPMDDFIEKFDMYFYPELIQK